MSSNWVRQLSDKQFRLLRLLDEADKKGESFQPQGGEIHTARSLERRGLARPSPVLWAWEITPMGTMVWAISDAAKSSNKSVGDPDVQ